MLTAFCLLISTIVLLAANIAEATLAAPLDKSGDDGTTNWDFIEPVTHLKVVPAGYTGIYTAQDLDNVRNDLAGLYVLMNDIDLSSWGEWKPIGSSTIDEPFSFYGTFNGNGYTIKGMQITQVETTPEHYYNVGYAGLFGYTASGTIKNLGMVGSNVHGLVTTESTYVYVGGITGYSINTVIVNCFNAGNVTVESRSLGTMISVGGISGVSLHYYGSPIITNSYNTGAVMATSSVGTYSGTTYAGGIAGQSGAQITYCFNIGDVSATARDSEAFAGGIAGTGGASYCYNAAKVTATASVLDALNSSYAAYAGGIVGQGGSTDNCYNLGDVVAAAPIIQSYSSPSVACAGGIVGDNGSASNCYNVGNVTATAPADSRFVGGITGRIFIYYTMAYLKNCFYNNITPNAIGNIENYDSWRDDWRDVLFDNVEALSTIEMKNRANFTGFDFDTVWAIEPSVNIGFPYLRVLVPRMGSGDDSVTLLYSPYSGTIGGKIMVGGIVDTKIFPNNFSIVWECSDPAAATFGATEKRANAFYTNVTLNKVGTYTITAIATDGATGRRASAQGVLSIKERPPYLYDPERHLEAWWPSDTITYEFLDTATTKNNKSWLTAMRQGMENWNNSSAPVQFEEVAQSYNLAFVSPYDDSVPGWNSLKFLGSGPTMFISIIRINSRVVDRSQTGFITTVFAHELGHTVGLLDYPKGGNEYTSLMWSGCHRHNITGPTAFDIESVNMLYNYSAMRQGASPLTSPISAGMEVTQVSAYDLIYDSIEDLATDATDVVRAEVLDERVEKLNTFLEEPPPEIDPYMLYTVYRIKVLEAYQGKAAAGDIMEVRQLGGQLDDELVVSLDFVPIAPGDDLVFFLRESYIENYPSVLVNAHQSTYKYAETGEMESVVSENDLVLTPEVLEQISERVFHTVTLNANGGNVTPASVAVFNGGTYSLLPVPSRSGYTFDGWYTAASGGAMVNPTDTVNLTNDIMLYARWAAIAPTTYTITATAGTGGTATGSGTFAPGANVTLTATPNAGYSFDGWYENGVKVTGAGASYSFSATANRTLEARFIAIPASSTITSVTVSPVAIEVQKGGTQQFAATVNGTNNPAQTVTWKVTGSSNAGTSISSSGLLTVAANETAATLTITATSTADTTKSGNATVTVTTMPPAPVYGISLNTSGTYVFAPAIVGYGAQAGHAVAITNTGNRATGSLTIALSGANASAFEVSPSTVTSIAVGGTGSFSVSPKTGLAAGTYTATVTVSGGNEISKTFSVSFTVKPKEETPPVFVPVTKITGVPTKATVGTNLTLSGMVSPANATNKTIVWSIKTPGSTGAAIVGSTFSASAAGQAIITATITNGATATTNYTEDFSITVSGPSTPSGGTNSGNTSTGNAPNGNLTGNNQNNVPTANESGGNSNAGNNPFLDSQGKGQQPPPKTGVGIDAKMIALMVVILLDVAFMALLVFKNKQRWPRLMRPTMALQLPEME